MKTLNLKWNLIAVILAALFLFSSACDQIPEIDPNLIGAENSLINTPTTWEANSVKTIDCALIINSILTIEEGSSIKFTENGSLLIGSSTNAALVADGSAEKPILFTGAASDDEGSWYGISFGANNLSNTTVLKNCTIQGAGKNNQPAITVDNTTISMDSCTVRYCMAEGIDLRNGGGFGSFEHNHLAYCGSYLLKGEPNKMLGLNDNNSFVENLGKNLLIKSGVFSTTGSLTQLSVPYVVEGILDVLGAELSVEPGVSLLFESNGELKVGEGQYAALIAEGTEQQPIVFGSSAQTPQAGDWRGIGFYSSNSSSKSIIKHAIIEYAGNPAYYDGAIQNHSGFAMENTTLRHSNTSGLLCYADGYFTSFKNNSISNCVKDPIVIWAENAHSIGLNNTLTASAGMGVKIEGSYITKDVRWIKQSVPYIINGGITVTTENGNAKLSIDPGTKLAFQSGVKLYVVGNGALSAAGKADSMIVFTSNATTPSAGDWAGIEFLEGTRAGTMLDYCVVEYAGNYDLFNIGITTSNVSITNSIIRHSSKYGIFIYWSDPAYSPIIQNNTFEGNEYNVYYEQ